ncbi:tetratricopeptide repeat protein [Pedobacter gandavensis]|uniref:Tetratricopeptide repeat protein n=1 Tax=Pedobacter gandavensis TaxID=2679963 RepID=A0ABR6F4B0_9SPHI|nr:tetratricopeptide repeat protein [Pedobacter gandavensis]MBB2151543.1 tetratricopeptide repeat protein [Pedobacter gandavensis]
MKKLLLFVILLTCTYYVNGQTTSVVDKEKLLDLFQSQRYLEAAQYLQGVYKDDTKDPKEISQLAYAYLMAGKLAEAEKNYLKLYAEKPDDIPGLFNLTNINLRRGNNAKAKEFLTKIVALDSNNFNAYKQIGRIEKEQGELLPMLKSFRTANRLNPTDADVAYDLSELYFKMKMYPLSLSVLEPALAVDTSNLQLLKMKMPASIGSKKYKEAILTGEKLLSYGDSSNFVLNNIAKSHFLLLNYQKALDYFLKVNNKSDDAEGLLYNISLSYRGIKDFSNAAKYLDLTIKAAISPKTSSYYGLLGDSYENIDKNDLANAAYKRGLLFENNGSLYYNIALVYETKLNDKKNAISYYQQYLKTVNAEEQPKLIVFIKNKIEELKR